MIAFCLYVHTLYGLMPEEGYRVKIHIVQKGDTLWKIAQKHGVDFEELKKMNAQLSNPEMVMPGMKIKVPEVGGGHKKEIPHHPQHNLQGVHKEMPHHQQGVHKEMPKVQHPYLPKKEAPKHVAKPPKEVKKEHPKEQPHTIYQPIMPQPQTPSEIDINNYYMMNMSQLQTQVQQPLPPQPVKQEVESPPKQEMPEKVAPAEYAQPMYPNYCYPVQPVMPSCDPCYPYPQPYPHQNMHMHPHQWMPQVQGAMMQPNHMQPAQQMPAFLPGMPSTSFPETAQQWDDESSHYPQMPMNQYPSYGQAQPSPYGQMPNYQAPPYHQPMMQGMSPAHGGGYAQPQAYPYLNQQMAMPQQMNPYGFGAGMQEGAGTYAMPARDDEEDDE